MALILVRHGERVDYAQPTWVAHQKQTTDGRPWDPPLTARGRLQAVAAGERLLRECALLGVPPPSQVYSSPFTRCVETAVGIARTTGVPTVNVEPALSEDMGEKWTIETTINGQVHGHAMCRYRSWALEESDGSWGGPTALRATPLTTEQLHPKASEDVSTLLLDDASHRERVTDMVDTKYAAVHSLQGQGICFHRPETREGLIERGLHAIAQLRQQRPSETIVLVTHGGPLTLLFNALEVEGGKRVKHAAYTAIALLLPTQGGGWTAPIAADSSHIDAVCSDDSAPASSMDTTADLQDE